MQGGALKMEKNILAGYLSYLRPLLVSLPENGCFFLNQNNEPAGIANSSASFSEFECRLPSILQYFRARRTERSEILLFGPKSSP